MGLSTNKQFQNKEGLSVFNIWNLENSKQLSQCRLNNFPLSFLCNYCCVNLQFASLCYSSSLIKTRNYRLQLKFSCMRHMQLQMCSCIRQVAHDIQLHVTLHMQHVYTTCIYMFIHTYQSKCSYTLCATFFATTIQLIKIWHMFKNLTTTLWTRVTIYFFVFSKLKIHWINLNH
jgi:hypothetical protein